MLFSFYTWRTETRSDAGSHQADQLMFNVTDEAKEIRSGILGEAEV